MSFTAAQIFELLGERRFSKPEYLWIGQVANSTGFGAYRYIDGVALSLWPSRGIHLHTVEIKVDRRDWLKEKATPEKAEVLAKWAHFMWLAIDGTAKQPVLFEFEEVPTNWGILEVVEQKGKPIVKTKRKATLLEPAGPTWGFVATVMRNADRADEARIDALAEARIDKRTSANAESWRTGRDELRKELDDFRQRVRKFERASGLQIEYATDTAEIGTAVRELLSADRRPGSITELERALNLANARAHAIQKALDEVNALNRARA